MADEEMIERCKDAIDKFPHWDFNNLEREQLVLAVIKAMREPTEKMLEAGKQQCFVEDSPSSVYMAMVEAIINE